MNATRAEWNEAWQAIRSHAGDHPVELTDIEAAAVSCYRAREALPMQYESNFGLNIPLEALPAMTTDALRFHIACTATGPTTAEFMEMSREEIIFHFVHDDCTDWDPESEPCPCCDDGHTHICHPDRPDPLCPVCFYEVW